MNSNQQIQTLGGLSGQTLFILVVLEIKAWVFGMLGKHSTTKSSHITTHFILLFLIF